VIQSSLTKIEIEDARNLGEKIAASGLLPKSSSWLITGVSGFLGSQFMNLFSALKKIGYDIRITGVDSGIRGDLRDWYVKDFDFVQFDITGNWKTFSKHDFILNLASIASPVFYRKFPLETITTNFNGTLNALEAAKSWESSILLMSSSEIYGDPQDFAIPTPEDYRGNVSCIGPRSCYDEGKRVTETLGWIYSNQFEVDVSIARPFNFYGPGMRLDDGRVLPDFMSSILKNQDIEIHSDGGPTRSFCYVSDAIEALVLMVLSSKEEKVYNVGSEESEISITHLAELIGTTASQHGWTGGIKYIESLEKDFLTNNPQRRLPNTQKIREELGWSATTNLSTGVLRTLAHFKETKN